MQLIIGTFLMHSISFLICHLYLSHSHYIFLAIRFCRRKMKLLFFFLLLKLCQIAMVHYITINYNIEGNRKKMALYQNN